MHSSCEELRARTGNTPLAHYCPFLNFPKLKVLALIFYEQKIKRIAFVDKKFKRSDFTFLPFLATFFIFKKAGGKCKKSVKVLYFIHFRPFICFLKIGQKSRLTLRLG